nr:reverse transcriptase domain-containing protein [Tanacetum cinerariifolium]
MIHRMYVDGGYSMEILYEHCFNWLRPEIKSQMVPATTSLTGFSGETIWPLGQLRLLVIIGDVNHSTRAWMNFMIVKSLPPYNGIIGRPGIRAIQAVPSTVHGMLKFLVEGWIVTIRSTVLIPTECTSVITSSAVSKEERTRPDNFKVALHPDFPDQEVAIGGTLSDKGRTELCSILKKNLDIFAWQPLDMTGVPRLVAEHRLNIREGYSPVRQKKRGQAPERAKAIQAEVQKLVEAGIMREVYYHDWLSNPVMVKKHDGSWRMCVDFTDLNKACLQDCYPLPEIDWKVESFCEVYVDDLVVKSYTKAEMMRDIDETFHTLRKINMKLNPKKCAFGLAEGVFLGYVVTPEGIKPCPDKTAAVLQLPSPRTIKEVQNLNEKLASLNRFLSKSAEKPRTYLSGFSHRDAGRKPTSRASGRNSTRAVDTFHGRLIMCGWFAASNNEAEYEALIAGLRIAARMRVKNVHVSVDSKLVANQALGTYVAKEDNMVKEREMGYSKHWLLILQRVVFVFLIEINGNPLVPALCLFGDSAMDVGNNNRLLTLLRANFLPYGRDFISHKPTGRFCNGKLAADYAAEYLGFDTYPPPYLDTANETLLLKGANFASAGSGYYERTSNLYQAISIPRQVSNYKIWQKRVVRLVGNETAKAIFSGGLHIISAGNSDFLQHYYINPILRGLHTPSQFSDMLLKTYSKFVQ